MDMKNMKLNATLMLALVMTLFTFHAMSQQRRSVEGEEARAQRPRMQHDNPRRLAIPDLTENQEAQIKALHVKMQKEKLPIDNELREKQARMRTLSTADDVDMKAINKLIEDMGALKIKIQSP